MKVVEPKLFRVLLYISILLNILDIVLHVVINQPEVLRIVGNILVIVGTSIAMLKWHPRLVLIIGLTAYLALNCIFIMFNGIGGAGIAFILVTTILTFASLLLQKPKQ